MLSRTAAIVGIVTALLSAVAGTLLFLLYAHIADAFGEGLSMRSRVNSLIVLIAPALVALIGIVVAKSWNSRAGKLLIVAGALWSSCSRSIRYWQWEWSLSQWCS